MPRDEASTVDFEAIAARRHMLQRKGPADNRSRGLRASYSEDLCLLSLRDPGKTQDQRLGMIAGWLLIAIIDEEQAAALAAVFGLNSDLIA